MPSSLTTPPPDILSRLRPPAGRALVRPVVSNHLDAFAVEVTRAQAEVEAARKAAAREDGWGPASAELEAAEDRLKGAEGRAAQSVRGLADSVRAGDPLFTRELPVSLSEQVGAEERRDHARRAAAGYLGEESASPVERELRETRREITRLRAELSGS